MDEIRNEAEKDPFLRRFRNSIGQRVRDLVADKFLGHYYQSGKMVPGVYVLEGDSASVSDGLEVSSVVGCSR